MNKTAIKNFAIWARNKFIADIHYRAGLLGITADGIANPLPQSTGDTEFYDIGTAKPYSIHGQAVKQRKRLVELLNKKAEESDYATAYKYVLEEVAYTWFNRLIAIRFMEVNDYLPSHIRVLSSESGKVEPDLVTMPFDADLEFTEAERASVIQLKLDNKLDELFRLLFIKVCNALNDILPALFEKTNDYTELLLSISVVDKDGVVYHLVNDIPEEDFDVEKGGQVEIIGWLYQYYNSEPKAEVFGRPSGTKIKKEDIPAATQLFTPDWIVCYMVENSLGRLWVEGHPEQKDNFLPSEAEQTAYREDHSIQDGKWHYYLEEAEQEPKVQEQLAEIRKEYARLNPEDIRCIDPCMGSGHILVYLFDVLMQIYEAQGYTKRDAAQSILKNNLYGLDIDDRAAQMAYFAVMMKARQYDRRILTRGIVPHMYAIQESNRIDRNQLNYFGSFLDDMEKNAARMQMDGLLDTLMDAKEYGSILQVENYDWELLYRFADDVAVVGQISLDTINLDNTQVRLKELVEIGQCLAQKYEVIVTNPPYAGAKGLNTKLRDYINSKYTYGKYDLFAAFIIKCTTLLNAQGKFSLITPNTFLFNPSYAKLRQQIASQINFTTMVELGSDAFEVGFGTVVYSGEDKGVLKNFKGRYYDVTNDPEKKFRESREYIASTDFFLDYDNYKFMYKLNERYRNIIINSKPLGQIGSPRIGMQTNDNLRFIREWFEVDYLKFCPCYDKNEKFPEAKWFPMVKGGGYRKWYGNITSVVNWANNGYEIKQANIGAAGGRIVAEEFYFVEGLTWTHTTYSQPFSIRYMPTGILINVEGPAIFELGKNKWYILACLNSVVAVDIFNKVVSSIHYSASELGRFPIILKNNEKIAKLSRNCIELSRNDWDSFEMSWNFGKHPFIGSASTVIDSFTHWRVECDNRFKQMKANEEELNQIFIDIYGLENELTSEVEDKDVTVYRVFDTKGDVPETMKGSNYILTRRDVIVSLISYSVGCMFGRYSLDMEGLAYAGGDWDSSKYTIYIPDEDNILPITDEEYFEDDIVGMFCAWVKKVYGPDTLEENLDFIAKALGNKGNSSREVIRNYFLKDFFKDHCKTYQKRPIYWLFDSGKQNGFKALVYLHRYNADTIGNLRVDYLHRMQRVYESEINRMQDMIDNSTNAREVAASTKRKDKLQKQLKECQEYDEKIGHLALSRIELDLDDGVKVNYRKVQTARDGKFYEVLADSKNIMGKQREK